MLAIPLTPFDMGDFGLPFFERETNFEFYDNWTKDLGPPRLQVRRRYRQSSSASGPTSAAAELFTSAKP